MVKKALVFLWLVLLGSQSNAQKAKVTSTLNFTGSIGKYAIEMKLMLNRFNDTISGEYYYVKSGKQNKIYLSGILKNGSLKLTESSYNLKKRKIEDTGFLTMVYVGQTSLTGKWQKNERNTDADQELTVKLNVRENLKAFNPIGFDFIISKKRPSYENVTENESKYFTIMSLQVNASTGNRWVLKGFNEHNLVKDEVNLEDVNFDGFLDIKVPIYYPDMAKNDYSYIYFLYDLKTNSFKQNRPLNDLGVLDFDAVRKEVVGYDADGSGNEGTRNYKWVNGAIFMYKEQHVYENDAYTYFTEYKVVNGKSVIAKKYKVK